MELVLSHAPPHSRGAADAARDHLLQLIDIISPAPLLVFQDWVSRILLRPLKVVDITPHSLFLERLREGRSGQCSRMDASYRDDL